MRKTVTVTLDMDETDGMMTWHISELGRPGLSGDYYMPIERGAMIADLGHELVSLIPKRLSKAVKIKRS